MKASELLFKSAEYISEYGHTKNALENYPNGQVCATGALRKILGYTNLGDPFIPNHRMQYEDQEAFSEAIYALREVIPHSFSLPVLSDWYSQHPAIYCNNTIVEWNNHFTTTEEDVILGMKQAAGNLAEAGR